MIRKAGRELMECNVTDVYRKFYRKSGLHSEMLQKVSARYVKQINSYFIL